MIDLGKDYGVHNHIHFFGDNVHEKIVYYFPNKLQFAQNEKGEPRMLLQTFTKSKESSAEALYNSAGSILEATIVTDVNAADLENGFKAVKKTFGLSDSVQLLPFDDWKSGTAEFVVLDAASKDKSSSEEIEGKSFVKRIIGSATPSIGTGGNLQCTFHSRLGPEATEMIQSRLEEGKGSLVSIEYALKYKAVRPSVQMRITADLSKCQETAQHDLGIDFKMYYYVDLSLGAQLEWLTKKMEENGSIVVEKFVDVDTPEREKAADELVKEFKEAVLKELFEPFEEMESKVSLTSNPQQASNENFAKQGVDLLKLAGKGGEQGKGNGKGDLKKEEEKPAEKPTEKPEEKPTEKPAETPASNSEAKPEEKPVENPADQQFAEKFHVGISYKMKQQKISLDRKIVVDYREQSTTEKPYQFNDSLDLMADKADQLKKCIMKEELGDLFKMQEVTVRFNHDFSNNEDGLLSADVCVWRAKDGVKADFDGKGYALKPGVSELKTFSFYDKNTEPQRVDWVASDENDIGYYYQVHLSYSGSRENTVSPREVFSKPALNYASTLNVWPEQFVYQKIYPIRIGDMSSGTVSQTDVTLTINPDTDKQLIKTIHLFKPEDATKFIVRSDDGTAVPVKVQTTFNFKDKRNPVTFDPYFQQEDEIIVNDPIAEKEFSFRMTGLESDMSELFISTTVHSKLSSKLLERTLDIVLKQDGGSRIVEKIPIYSADDVIEYTATLVKGGEDYELPEGSFSAGTGKMIPINLALFGKKRYTLQWDGKSPEDNGLDCLKVFFKDADGNVVETVEYAGPSVPDPKDIYVDGDKSLRMFIRREKATGVCEEDDKGIPVTSKVIVIKP